MALTTATEYKAYAGITDSSLDTIIGVHLNAAEYAIRRYCGRNLTNGFESTSRTETYDGNDEAVLHLAEWPVTTITSVSYIADDGSSTAYATTDYRVKGPTGELNVLPSATLTRFAYSDSFSPYGSDRFGVSPCWPEGVRNISVVYTGGYSTIPDDLKMAVWKMIDITRADAGANVGLQSESLGSYSYSRLTGDDRAATIRGILSIFRSVLC